MKILVCTDGSSQSLKAQEEAAKIALGLNADELAVINVYEYSNTNIPYWGEGITREGLQRLKELEEERKEERKKILSDAVDFFAKKELKASAIFKSGHPAETIIKVAAEEGYDMVIIGSRGLGALKKLFLGSVSNAVVQEANTNVLVVK